MKASFTTLQYWSELKEDSNFSFERIVDGSVIKDPSASVGMFRCRGEEMKLNREGIENLRAMCADILGEWA